MNVNHILLQRSYRHALEAELKNILDYWTQHTVDAVHGGFVGRLSNDNAPDDTADKGAVLNARILWSFAAAHNLDPEVDLALADRAYTYIVTHFIDKDFGGVYWTVDYQGEPKDTKKQVYAVAFTIYALSEYFMAAGFEVVKDHAIALYQELIEHSYDAEKGGYFEAFNREWGDADDLRLSDKDANEKKTMNTHLHVLEAFTNLYRIWPDAELRQRIVELIHDFTTHIIDADSGRMTLFFDEDWNRKSDMISFGHDIEASWLLLEAAETIHDLKLMDETKLLATRMADATLSGLDTDGALWYEQDPSNHHIIKEKHWWVQAEAMVGFFNAFQISKDAKFLNASLGTWHYVQSNLLDKEHGEWYWGRNENGEVMAGEDKVGLWKCPYHNSRACIEIIRRLKD
jgi:mannobiose 2-epimerase